MEPPEKPGRFILVPTASAGRRRLLIGTAEEALRPFLGVQDQSGPPVASVGPDTVAFLSAPAGGGPPVFALASAREGRLLKRFEETAGVTPQGLTASVDGRTLTFADKGSVFELPAEGGTPRKICAGDGVAADPSAGGLVLQRNGAAGVELVRRSPDGSETPILITGDLVPSSLPLSGRAVAPDGRIVLTATSRGGWTSVAAILVPSTGAMTAIPVLYQGDVLGPSWSPDGKILAMGTGSRSELWVFRKQAAGKAPSSP